MVFNDLEKVYDIVPRQEAWRCMREKGVPENYVMIVQDTYEGARTRVKSMIIDVLARGIKDLSPWCILLC